MKKYRRNQCRSELEKIPPEASLKYYVPLMKKNKFFGLLGGGYWIIKNNSGDTCYPTSLVDMDLSPGFIIWEAVTLSTGKTILWPVKIGQREIVWREKLY